MSDAGIKILLTMLAVTFGIPLLILLVYFLSRAVSFGWHMGKFSAIFQRRLHNQGHERVSDES